MEAKRRQHVILFPFMAQGHITPFLALALKIEKKGYDVTFINTPLNVKHLRSSFPTSPSSSIRFREIPFNSSDHGLPPNTENTDNLPYDLIIRLVQVSASLKPTFRQTVLNILHECQQQDAPLSPPLCIISDFFYGWTAEVAREFNIFHLIFAGSGAFGMAVFYSLWTSIPDWKVDGAMEFENNDFPENGKIHATQVPGSMAAANGTDSWSVFNRTRLQEWRDSNGILLNTVEKIDKVGLEYFERKLGLPVYPIGPILLKKKEITSHECLKWLEEKPPRSVLYICFGSQNTLTMSQMKELALALEASKKPFIWVVRPPLGTDYKSDFKADEWLPKGFEKRIQEQKMGLLVWKWAPQVEILSHKSVGGFISHCGWNSILESISHGVPILGWPMAAEQFFNAKFLVEEVGVCIEIGRGNSCEVKHEDITKKVELAMAQNGEGERIRKRVYEVRGIIEDASKDERGYKGSSARAMDDFFRAAVIRAEQSTSAAV